MSGGFYRAAPPDLSQGDIVTDVPWGLIEAPITLCRPDDRTKASGKARYSAAEPWALKGVAGPWGMNHEQVHATARSGPAMVLWHDCQIDKAINQNPEKVAKAFAAIAPILPLEGRPDEFVAAVTEARHHAYFHLPAVTLPSFSLPPSYVDLRHIWSIRQLALTGRAVTLALDFLPALYSQLFVFFTRARLNSIPTCPSCGSAVPLSAVEDES